MGHPVLKVLWALVGTTVIFFLTCSVVGCVYMIAVEKDCAGDAKICDELPPDHQPTFLNGFYYAAQTMTTTGYGSGIVLKTKRTQLVSVLAMPITALWWGIEIALIYDAVKDAVSRRRAGG